MPKTKYFAGIAEAQARQVQPGADGLAPFDFNALAPGGAFAAFRSAATVRLLRLAHAFSRRYMPLMPLAGLLHVTRDRQVREILLRSADFVTPFGPEMAELGGGATFLLGLEGPEHDRLHAILRQAIRSEDAERVGTMSMDFTRALLDNSAGEIDVIADLIKRVPAEICLRYFGLECDDASLFGDWTMALSAFLFGDPYGDPKARRLAMNARTRIDAVTSQALRAVQRRARSGRIEGSNAQTLVERLVLIQREQPLEDREIKAILMGLATGFIPTNSLAASNMLGELLNRRDAWQAAVAAAQAQDHAAMRAIVLEAGRLNPALAPGQWRYCPRDAVIEVDGKDHLIKAGTTLLVATMSALRDPRVWDEPGRFRLDRRGRDGKPQDPDLVFGVGAHWCLGKHLAIEQISALFMALLARPGLRPAPGRAGRLKRVGPFPRHRIMRFDTPASAQSMFVVLAQLAEGVTQTDIDARMEKLGNPAGDAIRKALDRTGLVHFCSLAAIQTDKGLRLCFELSVDGPADCALQAIVDHAGELLRPVFSLCAPAPGEDFAGFLRARVVTLHGRPWGATGLNYNGLAEFPIFRVGRQARFADFTGRVLRDFVANESLRGSHPMLAIRHLRRVLRGDSALRAQASPAQLALIEEAQAEGWDAFHLQGQANRLNLSRFKQPGYGAAFARFLRSRDGRMLTWPLGALYLLWALALPLGSSGWSDWLGLLAVRAPLATGLSAAVLIAAALVLLRRAEKRDLPDHSHAPLDKIRRIVAVENAPGYAQNHILAVGTLKTGLLRKLSHAFALWAIRVVIQSYFRPGTVVGMGTIHYARWWRIPGTGTVAFYANFDGSWENYLEDFITRAHQGQSAAWSHWQGFPRTRFLLTEGASDGDEFKRWERVVQQPVPFWYSRFPRLTSDQIRNNALIHSGAGLAQDTEQSEEWLRCFGSMPRLTNRIESDEIQTLVFSGMRQFKYSACLTLVLPNGGEQAGEWLCWLRGQAMQAQGAGGSQACQDLVAQGILQPVARPEGQPAEFALASHLALAFGEHPLGTLPQDDGAMAQGAVYLALGPAGLARFEAPNCKGGALLEGMPFAFRMGMAARARITGDVGVNAPANWRWSDDPCRANSAEAVLLIYAPSPEALEEMGAFHHALLENHGGRVLNETSCAPAWADPAKEDFEHFGYRDGISQPVIKGTGRSLRDVPERDLIEPGEFILGYANAQGYLPPSPVLPAEADIGAVLPPRDLSGLSRYPDFGSAGIGGSARDFGRNGTYLVLREIRQDVEGFETFTRDTAARLSGGGHEGLTRLIGQSPSQDWVKAKLMGRWPDGRPLVGNPVAAPTGQRDSAEETANDFTYGRDDPQGLACPMGSHIRRTNPRDSKQPAEKHEQEITNRHRILRRGRAYQRSDNGERGLLFACLCADIDRQFEFVQQFWANAPAFHTLDQEPDPIVGSDPVDPLDGTILDRVFTIPTVAGSVQIDGLRSFVQIMAGGYFFLPSRSALGWLSEAALVTQQEEGS